MSHKLQLHLLLDHISAKVTASTVAGLRSLANDVCGQVIPLCLRTRGTRVRNCDLWGFWLEELCHRKSYISFWLSNVLSRGNALRTLSLLRTSRCLIVPRWTPIARDLFLSGEMQIPFDRFYMQEMFFVAFFFSFLSLLLFSLSG